MSELVSRIRELSARIIDLEDSLMAERRKYADEVDHSDQLAYFMSLLHNGKDCPPLCSFCDIVRTHERRRAKDYGLLVSGEE